jgi:hypothetical protein
MMHDVSIPDTWRIQFDLGIVIAMHSRGVKISATLNQRMLPVSHVSAWTSSIVKARLCDNDPQSAATALYGTVRVQCRKVPLSNVHWCLQVQYPLSSRGARVAN